MPRLSAVVAEKARKDDEALPAGRYYLEVVEYDAKPETAHSKTGKYMPSISFKVLQPAEYAGRKLPRKEYFVLGTDEDPEFEDENTKGPGLGRFKRLTDAAGVSCDGEVDEVLAEVQTVGAILSREVQPEKNRDGTTNEYAGRVQNEIKSFFAVGDHAPEIFPDTTGGTASTTSSKVAALKAAAKGTKASPVPATAGASKGFGSK